MTPQPDDRHDATSRWLLTFSDLVALMLAFFVMMYATNKVETGDWQAMIESLSQSLRVERLKAAQPSAERNVGQRNEKPAISLDYLRTLFEALQSNEPALAGATMRQYEDRLVIALPDALLFGPGRADPVPGARQRVRLIAELMRNLTNRVDVFGHTDRSPVAGRLFESNRELSLARAETIAEMMREAGYPRRIGAFGLADAHFDDVAAIRSPQERSRLARRVDIVVRPEAEFRE